MKKTLTGYGLKIIAMISMLIDHIAAAVLEHSLYADFPSDLTVASYNAWKQMHATGLLVNDLMRTIGRIAFPIFAFLLAEGVLHTSDIRKYARNLFLFALLSEIPFNLAFHHQVIYPGSQNVMFTLFLGVLMLGFIRHFTVERAFSENAAKAFIPAGAVMAACISWIYSEVTTFSWGTLANKAVLFEKINFQWPMPSVAWVCAAAGGIICFLLGRKLPVRTKSAATYVMFISSIAMTLGKFLHTDYGGAGILTILLIYLLRENCSKQILASWAALSLHTITSSLTEVGCILSAPFISLYNGQRGRGKKYFFYIFYPAHLLVLFLISGFILKK